MEKQIYIITGGPGFGKTYLIEELRKMRFLCSDEFAREIIVSQLEIGGELLPWKNPKLFQEQVLSKRIDFYESVPENTIAFADRGIPDQMAYASYKGFEVSERMMKISDEHKYASTVFIAPPWYEIFKNDQLRTETFSEAVKIDEHIRETYSILNYQIIELPLFSVNERIEFILQNIQNPIHNGN